MRHTHDVLVFPVPHTQWTLNLHFLVPNHFQNAWTVVAYALVVSAIVKSVCDYVGDVPGELCGVRDDYGPAERSLQRGVAAVGGIFSEAYDGHAAVYADQRYRARAVCDVECAGRFYAAGVHADFYWRAW